MDKTIKYQHVIRDLLKEYAAVKKTLTPEVKSQIIFDPVNHHYQLLSVGWHGQKFIYSTAFHFDIVDGKIWIQQNNTEAMIADELMERGVPKSDIVLGFVAPSAREYSGFATT
jgi:XisI protein